MGQELLIIEALLSHSGTPHSVGVLCTGYQPDEGTSVSQHRTLKRDRHPCPQVGFEPTITESKRPQTHALDSATTGNGIWAINIVEYRR